MESAMLLYVGLVTLSLYVIGGIAYLNEHIHKQ